MKLKLLIVMFLVSTITLNADTLKTLEGKVYTKVMILEKKPTGLSVMHSGGVVFVKFSSLSAEICKKYGYDPAKAAEFQKKDNAKKAKYQAAKRKKAELAKFRANYQNPKWIYKRINELEKGSEYMINKIKGEYYPKINSINLKVKEDFAKKSKEVKVKFDILKSNPALSEYNKKISLLEQTLEKSISVIKKKYDKFQNT